MPFMVESATELTLGANRNLTDAQRLQWKTKGHTTDGSKIFFFSVILLQIYHKHGTFFKVAVAK